MRSLKHLALTAAFATSAGTIGISAAQASSPAASPATTGASTTTANSPAFTCNQLGTPPKDTRLYADRMLAAWGNGQRPQVGCYAIDQVVQFAFAERGKQVGSWVFVSKVHNNEEFFDTVTYRGVRAGLLSRNFAHAAHVVAAAGMAGAAFSGLSAMTASVVRNSAAMEAAFCSASGSPWPGR
jgi:hypothetical protein